MSQTELAKLTGVSQAAISLLENQARVPRTDTAMALAAALGCEVADLFSYEGGES